MIPSVKHEEEPQLSVNVMQSGVFDKSTTVNICLYISSFSHTHL